VSDGVVERTSIVNPNWHLEFFSGVALDLWRNVIPQEMTAGEVSFLESELHLKPGDKVMDLACGEGRHGLALARKRCRVTGVDTSRESISSARAASEREQLPAEWVEADMCELPSDRTFDAAYCFGNSFGYLNRLHAQTFLSRVCQSLRPGGRFAIDTGMTAESILPNLPINRWHRIGEIIMLAEYSYGCRDSRLDITYTFIRDGVVESRPSCSYVFTLAELIRMVDEAGLRVDGAYRSVQREPFELRAPRLLLSLVK
jgi:SAM-dependent methyltransferase